ncbi:hypothetical protein [Dyadobacter psychrotolerans]|uniref:Uncharacterized protein n=1 Tax=Dyadobacter psychrotolerans TaxID=2541721 RepID=A0A4R5DJ97_9BACT|nr:hypothetical protein [Dyadobacter psychrotolerans]TDE12024.1 hypothetical protein E0F88_23505 [Dyadobacter psychrotolerans]
MEFLYKYYYTFYVLHQKDVTEGRKPGLAWLSTMFQLTVGIGCLMMGATMLILHLTDLVEVSKEYKTSRLIIFLVFTAGPFSLLYNLLFNYFRVSKETGRTDNSNYEITRFWKVFFWIFWVASCFLPFYVALIANGYGFSNLSEIPWSPKN